MRIGVISDTHGKLRSTVFDAFEGVDLILHAGDIGGLDIITELEAIAPVQAVHGNTDVGTRSRSTQGGTARIVEGRTRRESCLPLIRTQM